MRKLRLVLPLALVAILIVPLIAQERAIAGSTLQTTDTTANSLLVGCAVGSTTCTGGIKAGALVIGGGTSIASSTNIPLKDATTNAFSAANAANTGASFTNTTSGVGAFARLNLVGASVNTFLDTFSQGFTTSGSAIQSGTRLLNDSAGGIALDASNAAGTIKMFTVGALRWGINSAGDFTFGASSHISDSSGTPTASGQPGVLTSGVIDSAIQFVKDGTSTSQVQVTFGHTWTNAPVCVSSSSPALAGLSANATTTVVTVQYTATTTVSTINVICRGF